jgi:cold shock CspA family protein
MNNNIAGETKLKKRWIYTGKVCNWIPNRDYGFIRMQGRKNDLYFHVDGIDSEERTSLTIGELVTFEVYYNPRTGRPKAIKIKVIDTVRDVAANPVGFTLLKAPHNIFPVFQVYNHYNTNSNKNQHYHYAQESIDSTTGTFAETIAYPGYENEVQAQSFESSNVIAHHFQPCVANQNTEPMNQGYNVNVSNGLFSDAYMQYITFPQIRMNTLDTLSNFMNAFNMPMNTSQEAVSMKVSCTELNTDDTSLLFPISNTTEFEQTAIVNANLEMRPTYNWSFQHSLMMKM